jgi:ribonuclease HI
LEFNCTNNIAEYKVVLLGLQKLRAMGIRRAVLKSDLQVITCQVDKSSKARDPKIEKYLDTVRRMGPPSKDFQ